MPQIQRRWWVSDGTVCGIYPDDFFGGSTKAIYRQFSIYYCFSNDAILVALILTPELCATLLKPVSAEHYEKKAASLADSMPNLTTALTTIPTELAVSSITRVAILLSICLLLSK